MRICNRGIFCIFSKSVHITYFFTETVTLDSFSILCAFSWPNSAYFCIFLPHILSCYVPHIFKKLPHETEMPNKVNNYCI